MAEDWIGLAVRRLRGGVIGCSKVFLFAACTGDVQRRRTRSVGGCCTLGACAGRILCYAMCRECALRLAVALC